MRKIFLIVLDSLGIGAAPDAHIFGDEGTNTLKRISGSRFFDIPTLTELGMGCIDGIDYIKRVSAPRAATGRLKEISAGKDTTIGHWEIAGHVSKSALPTQFTLRLSCPR